MKNAELVKNFVYGDTKGKTANLKIEGDKLVSYNTVIAQRRAGKVMLINGTKYSPTTSKIQNMLKRLEFAFDETSIDVPRGAGDLTRYI